jgi:hypothetical protein
MCSMHTYVYTWLGGRRWVIYPIERYGEEVATCKIDGAVINRYYAMCFFNINWSALMMLWKRAIVYSACIFCAPATDLPETSGLVRLQRRRKFCNEHCATKLRRKTRLVRERMQQFLQARDSREAISLFSCAFVYRENCKRFAWILLLFEC